MFTFFFRNIHPRQIVLKNTFWLYFAQITSRFVKFFLVTATARILGPSEYGIFTYASYVLGLFFIFSDGGLSQYLIREYQKKDNPERANLLSTITFLKILLVGIVAIIALVFSFLIHQESIRQVYLVMLILFTLGPVKDFCISFLRANNRMEFDSLIITIDAVVTTLLGLFFLYRTHSLVLLALAYVLGTACALTLSILSSKRYLVKPRFINFNYAKKVLFTSLPFLFGAIVVTLLSEIDIIMLKHFKDIETVGQYAAGLKLIQLTLAIPGPFIVSLYPIFSSLLSERERITSILKQSFQLVLMLGIPITVGGLLLARQIITTLYGSAYSQSIQTFAILCFLVPVLYGILVLDSALVSLNYQFKNMLYTAFSALLNVALNFILIPHFSGVGAAFASLISQIVNLLVTYRLTKKVLGEKIFRLKSLLLYLGASTVMGASLLTLSNFIHAPLIILIPLGAAVYAGSLLLMKEEYIYKLIGALRR